MSLQSYGREFEKGVLLGSGSVDRLSRNIKESIGKWASLVPYLDELHCRDELELVAAINYIMGKPVTMTPTLQVCFANALARSSRGILVSVEQIVRGGGDEGRGEV